MNLIDIILLVIVLLSVWSGWRKGFIVGALDLLTWVGSLWAGFYFYPDVATYLEKYIPSLGVWAPPVAFILVIIVARLILSLIVSLLLRTTTAEMHYNGVNRFLGIFPGMLNGLVWATILSALLLALPLADIVSAKTRDSKIAPVLAQQADWLNEKLSPVFDKAINQTLNKLTIHPESNKSVNLPYTVTNAKVRADLEDQMLEMVNKERIKEGLKPLQADPEMTVVAREHSRDMFARGYFAHVSPEGKNPFDRMKNRGVTFLTAGENLALAQTLPIAHRGLMNSPGHRANILHAGFGRVGIGILDGGIHGLMISQEFRN